MDPIPGSYHWLPQTGRHASPHKHRKEWPEQHTHRHPSGTTTAAATAAAAVAGAHLTAQVGDVVVALHLGQQGMAR